ncbi:PREDICTED: protein FAR-RED IMPAIRED RESPONSE 1-like [Prunus mume]|uniref:Protein FAR1-RELATED SEQUENCE n=1 Tax=Prunus mume TaxID=102107 RepID=A0ABM0NZK7_PRUMU|nr:PREDICTED: protein FAR-RED IMPAIRED RESPONSE 1-like [Prunus mume]
MEVDSEGRMGNVFWSDARSRRAYGFFGDVVVFDTTFNTCYEFKKAMPGEPPKMIITDQNAAMSKAIVVTLPTTFHKYCIWHILNKFTEKPGIGECFSKMCKCIWGMDTNEEFDAKWEITNNGQKDHPWLSSIHAMRENWVPSYVKHVFLAGMSSSQRAESCHSFFKQYINWKNTLMEFIVCFERALGLQRHKELMADHVDNNEKPTLPFRTPIQHQMTRIYTRAILEMFEREDFRSLLCLFELIEQDETRCKYKVSERVNPGVTRMKELVHDKDADKAYCSGKGFKFWGISCRHILAFLRMKQVEHLPNNTY